MVQTKPVAAAMGFDVVPPIVHEVLRTPGQPLDPESRAFFEPRFRDDFSLVRIYADARAAESARSLRARAYTVGQQVVFGRGYLNTVYWYNQHLDDLEYDYDGLQRKLNPILKEVRGRTRALYEASEEVLKWVPRMPSETAQLQLWGVYESLHDAALDLSQLEDKISTRLFEYKQSRDKAHGGRIESARWINYWSPAYQKILGRKLLTIHVSEE